MIEIFSSKIIMLLLWNEIDFSYQMLCDWIDMSWKIIIRNYIHPVMMRVKLSNTWNRRKKSWYEHDDQRQALNSHEREIQIANTISDIHQDVVPGKKKLIRILNTYWASRTEYDKNYTFLISLDENIAFSHSIFLSSQKNELKISIKIELRSRTEELHQNYFFLHDCVYRLIQYSSYIHRVFMKNSLIVETLKINHSIMQIISFWILSFTIYLLRICFPLYLIISNIRIVVS